MNQTCISCLFALTLFANARADEKKQKTDESPRLTVDLELSVESYDPRKPAGTLTCVVNNRSTEEIRSPGDYDGRTLIIYGGGKTHRQTSRLWRPIRKAKAQLPVVTIGPGEREPVLEISLKDLLTFREGRSRDREWAWNWPNRTEPPKTPIHGWRRPGFEESASFFAEFRIGEEKVRSEVVVLTVEVPDEID